MNKKEIEEEYKKLSFELLENKPKIKPPYPPDIVKRRELLLLAQVHLNNILGIQLKKDGHNEQFEIEMYHKIMETYHNWGRDG